MVLYPFLRHQSYLFVRAEAEFQALIAKLQPYISNGQRTAAYRFSVGIKYDDAGELGEDKSNRAQ
jgi:hypothetical protein